MSGLIKEDVSLPHELSNNSSMNYRDFYSKDLQEFVKDYYQEEIELFNYSF